MAGTRDIFIGKTQTNSGVPPAGQSPLQEQKRWGYKKFYFDLKDNDGFNFFKNFITQLNESDLKNGEQIGVSSDKLKILTPFYSQKPGETLRTEQRNYSKSYFNIAIKDRSLDSLDEQEGNLYLDDLADLFFQLKSYLLTIDQYKNHPDLSKAVWATVDEIREKPTGSIPYNELTQKLAKLKEALEILAKVVEQKTTGEAAATANIEELLVQIRQANERLLHPEILDQIIFPLLDLIENASEGAKTLEFKKETYAVADIKKLLNFFVEQLQNNARQLYVLSKPQNRLNSTQISELENTRSPFTETVAEEFFEREAEINPTDPNKAGDLKIFIEKLIGYLSETAPIATGGAAAEAEDEGGGTEPEEPEQPQQLAPDEFAKYFLQQEVILEKLLNLAKIYANLDLDNQALKALFLELLSQNPELLELVRQFAVEQNWLNSEGEVAIANLDFNEELADSFVGFLNSNLGQNLGGFFIDISKQARGELETQTEYEQTLTQADLGGDHLTELLPSLVEQYLASQGQKLEGDAFAYWLQAAPDERKQILGVSKAALGRYWAFVDLALENYLVSLGLSRTEAKKFILQHENLRTQAFATLLGLNPNELKSLDRIRLLPQLQLALAQNNNFKVSADRELKSYADSILKQAKAGLEQLNLGAIDQANLQLALDSLLILVDNPEGFIDNLTPEQIALYFNLEISPSQLSQFKANLKQLLIARKLTLGQLNSLGLKRVSPALLKTTSQISQKYGVVNTSKIYTNPHEVAEETPDLTNAKQALIKAIWDDLRKEEKIKAALAGGFEVVDGQLPGQLTGRDLINYLTDQIEQEKNTRKQKQLQKRQEQIFRDAAKRSLKGEVQKLGSQSLQKAREGFSNLKKLNVAIVVGKIIGLISGAISAALTWGGLFGGIVGGIGGFIVGGPAGMAAGFTGGSIAGGLAGEKYLGAINTAGGGPLKFFTGVDLRSTFSSAAKNLTSASSAQAAPVNLPASGTGSIAGVGMSAGTAATIGVGAIATISAASMIGLYSAFLAPVTPELQGEISKYLEIDKNSNPKQMENDTPADVEYQIEISPKTNPDTGETYKIKVSVEKTEDNFSFIGEDKPNVSSPIEEVKNQLRGLVNESGYLEAGTISYTIPQLSGVDVLVSNKFILYFDVEGEGEEQKLIASNHLRIGNPPTGCFVFSDENIIIDDGPGYPNKPWTDEDEDAILFAYLNRAGSNDNFNSLLCGDGQEIILHRADGPYKEYGGVRFTTNSTIFNLGLYDYAFESPAALEYTLIHELGHIIDHKNGVIKADYVASRPRTLSCFTYPLDHLCSDSESFTEGIALFTVYKTYVFSTKVDGFYDFPNRNPVEYAWFRDNIFGGEEF